MIVKKWYVLLLQQNLKPLPRQVKYNFPLLELKKKKSCIPVEYKETGGGDMYSYRWYCQK
jgi:hypothetical protein